MDASPPPPFVSNELSNELSLLSADFLFIPRPFLHEISKITIVALSWGAMKEDYTRRTLSRVLARWAGLNARVKWWFDLDRWLLAHSRVVYSVPLKLGLSDFGMDTKIEEQINFHCRINLYNNSFLLTLWSINEAILATINYTSDQFIYFIRLIYLKLYNSAEIIGNKFLKQVNKFFETKILLT